MDKKYIIGLVVLVIIILGAMFIVNNKINSDNEVNVNDSLVSENGVSAVSENYKLITVEDISFKVPENVNLIEQSDDKYEKIYNKDVDYYTDSELNYGVLIFDNNKDIKQFLKNYLHTFKDNKYTKIKDKDLNSSYHVFKEDTSDGGIYHIIFVIKEIDDDDKEFKLVEIFGKDLNQVKKSALTAKSIDD